MAQDSREVHHVGGLICCAGIVLAVQYVFMDYVENYIETHFSTLSGLRWLDQHWYISWTCSVAYVALLYLGAKWMKHRKPYNLRRPLLMWNMALAIFSIATFRRSEVPKVAEKLFTEGIEEVSCRSTSFDNPKHLVWIFLFTVFKVVELGDTAFIVLRKTPLNFLHWYHHITVLVYSWYIVPQRPASAIMFLAMNSAVHSIMYSLLCSKGSRISCAISACHDHHHLADTTDDRRNGFHHHCFQSSPKGRELPIFLPTIRVWNDHLHLLLHLVWKLFLPALH